MLRHSPSEKAAGGAPPYSLIIAALQNFQPLVKLGGNCIWMPVSIWKLGAPGPPEGIVTFAHYRHFWAISVRLPDPQIIDFAHLSRRTPCAFDM